MAYYVIERDGSERGPFPCDEGEYCGPYSESIQAQPEPPFYMRKGRPRATRDNSEQELMTMGVCGLYLMMSIRHLIRTQNMRFVPTPPELTEPTE